MKMTRIVRKALVALTACAMLIGIGAVSAYVGTETAQAASSAKPSLAHAPYDGAQLNPDGTLYWAPITQFNAIWKDQNGNPTSLENDAVYWQDDDQARQIQNNYNLSAGFEQAMLMKNTYAYNKTDDENGPAGAPVSMENDAVMYFRATQDLPKGSKSPNPFGSTSYILFSTQGIGVFGGQSENPGRARSIYFWDYGGRSTYFNSDTINCKDADAASNDPNDRLRFTPVIRVDDYAAGDDPLDITGSGTNIFWTCMPTPYNNGDSKIYDSAFGSTSREATGGEVSQVNGYIYMSGLTSGKIINPGSKAKGYADTGNYNFAIWDPVTGRFARSSSLQAGDWDPNVQVKPKDQLKATIFNIENQGKKCTDPAVFAAAQETLNKDCTYAGSLDATADMGLDVDGNMYLYASSGASNTGSAILVRITPSIDDNGNIIDYPNFKDLSSVNPWRYTVVTHTYMGSSFYKASSKFEYSPNIWGVGIHNGFFLLGAEITFTDVRPLGWDKDLPKTCNFTLQESNCTHAPDAQARINPLTGEVQAIAATRNTSTPLNSTNRDPYYSANASGGHRDAASSELLILIQGNVYDDANASADPNEFKKSGGLGGQILDLYDSNGRLVGTTTSATDGSYNFIVSGSGTYYVRLVQPKVDGVNAYQTWASATNGIDVDDNETEHEEKSTVNCVNATGGIVEATSDSGKCQGAQSFPYIDPNPPLKDNGLQNTGSIDTAGWNNGNPTWAYYGKVTLNGTDQTKIPIVNFAVSTAKGSFGDASGSTGTNVGPFRTTKAQNGAFFKNPNLLTSIFGKSDGLQLGDNLGDYTDGYPDANANSNVADVVTNVNHTQTDDGVKVVIPADASKSVGEFCGSNASYTDTAAISLQSAALTAGRSYCIKATVKGSLAKSAIAAKKPSVVLGWQSEPGKTKDGGWTDIKSTVAYAQWVGDDVLSTSTGGGTAATGDNTTYETYATLTVPTKDTPDERPVQTRFTVMSYDFFMNNGGSQSITNTDGSVSASITTTADDCGLIAQTNDDGIVITGTDGKPVYETDDYGNYLCENGIYSGPKRFSDEANTQYWVQPGEVEDYQYYDVTSAMTIFAKVTGSGELNPNPLVFRYNLDSSTVPPSTNKDAINVTAFDQVAASGVVHSPKKAFEESGSSITVTTGIPQLPTDSKRSLALAADSGDALTCTGSYLDKSAIPQPVSVKVVATPLDEPPADAPIPDDADQVAAADVDKSQVSWKLTAPDYSGKVSESQRSSGLMIVCTFNYVLNEFTGELPLAGTIPWLSTTGIVLLVVGTAVGTAYAIVWNRKRNLDAASVGSATDAGKQ